MIQVEMMVVVMVVLELVVNLTESRLLRLRLMLLLQLGSVLNHVLLNGGLNLRGLLMLLLLLLELSGLSLKVEEVGGVVELLEG